MKNKKLHYFFYCYYCGAIFQSIGRIKQRKCNFCNNVIQFNQSKKIKYNCTDLEAVAIIKHLKECEKNVS